MAESYLFLGDALLYRRPFPRTHLRGLSYDDDGEGEADAKNPNSNHDLLFHDSPSTTSADLAAVRRYEVIDVPRLATRSRNRGASNGIVATTCSMIRPAPYFACPNHTLLNNGSMNLLIRLTSLISRHPCFFLMSAGWFGRTLTSSRDDPTRNVDIWPSSTVQIR